MFFLTTIPALLLVAVMPGFDRRRRIARFTARLILRLAGIPLETRGLHNIPEGSCIVVSNHASYLDGIVMTAALPPVFSFVIKREVTSVPGVHLMLRRLGSQFVDRFDYRRSAVDARRFLRSASSGQALAFFPEGTFRAEPGLRRFHAGAFVAAARSRLPVVPTVIRGTRALLPADCLLPCPGRVEVRILPALFVAGDQSSDIAALRDCARQQILAESGEPDLSHVHTEQHGPLKAGP